MEIIDKTLQVSALKEGTVIDHIPAGLALKILNLLGLSQETVTLGLNLSSQKLKKKDVLKIKDRILTEKEATCISLFSQTATVNLISQFTVVKKYTVSLPETIVGIFSCPNLHCITNAKHKEVVCTFTVDKHRGEIVVFCKYCERMFKRDDL